MPKRRRIDATPRTTATLRDEARILERAGLNAIAALDMLDLCDQDRHWMRIQITRPIDPAGGERVKEFMLIGSRAPLFRRRLREFFRACALEALAQTKS